MGFKGFRSGFVLQIFAIKCGFCLTKKGGRVSESHSQILQPPEKQKLILCSLKVWAIIACSEHPHHQAVIKAEKEAPEMQKPLMSSPSSNLTLCDLFDYVDYLQQQQKLCYPENPPFLSVTGELFSQASLSQD